MTLMWFRCHIPHLTPTHFGYTLSAREKERDRDTHTHTHTNFTTISRHKYMYIAHDCILSVSLIEVGLYKLIIIIIIELRSQIHNE